MDKRFVWVYETTIKVTIEADNKGAADDGIKAIRASVEGKRWNDSNVLAFVAAPVKRAY